LHFADQGANIVFNLLLNRESTEETATAIHELGQQALALKANVGTNTEALHYFDSAQGEGLMNSMS
jgi:hypothetical protein